jgi:succinate dehydrogenase / fumarate reductase, membrane anchor subunit
MSAPERSMRTPLGRVRHHGASGGGTEHFIAQRVSAIVLIVLATWFVLAAALTMSGPSYVAAIDFIADPINAVGIVLLILTALFHMRIGLQTVIEDYIHRPATKMFLLLLNALVPLAIAAGGIFAVLAVNFGV